MSLESCPYIELSNWLYGMPVDPTLFDSEIRQINNDGLVLEFGVATGTSIERIRKLTKRKVYGFDSFEGLPEDWNPKDPKGSFKCDPPEVSDGIYLIRGLFQDTLDDFLKQHGGSVALCHIDSDLYSSAAFVLSRLKDRFVSGSLLIFDEIFGHEAVMHEARAFYE